MKMGILALSVLLMVITSAAAMEKGMPQEVNSHMTIEQQNELLDIVRDFEATIGTETVKQALFTNQATKIHDKHGELIWEYSPFSGLVTTYLRDRNELIVLTKAEFITIYPLSTQDTCEL